jgi:hypothetical protein
MHVALFGPVQDQKRWRGIGAGLSTRHEPYRFAADNATALPDGH